MSIANKDTFFASGSGAQTIVMGEGRVYGFVASTDAGTPDAFTIYDSAVTTGAELITVNIPNADPVTAVFFPKDMPLVFTEGLTIDPGNCDVLLFIAA